VRADIVVPAALRAHKLKSIGSEKVLGRTCQVFRSAAPLRTGLTVERAADIVWTLNSTDVFLLLTDGRGWSAAEYEQWLGDLWVGALLTPGAAS
jgi:hypothetical protein